MSGHHHHHNHSHGAGSSRKALLWAFLINAAFLIIEFIGGVLSGSLALLADAGHMLTDVAALGVAIWVAKVVTRPPSSRRTYGYGRAEVISGLLNGLSLWVIVAYIVFESIKRFWEPQTVDVQIMLPVAVAGLLANVISAVFLMSHHKGDLNIRGAFLHLVADAVGSVGAILAALAIHFGGWAWADPLASLFIALLIFSSSWGLVKDSIHILLEGAPENIDSDKIRSELKKLEKVEEVHDLHVWCVGSGELVLTAHMIVKDNGDYQNVLLEAKEKIKEKFNINHTTFQVESVKCKDLHL